MSRAGLHKVTKTVKGGKRRAYWVKSDVPVVRAAGRALANTHVQTGLKVAALVGGTALAAHLGKKHMGKLGGIAMGLHEGLKTLKERGDSGAVAHLKGHLSTSKKKNWRWSGQHRFVVYGGSGGKDISEINPMEEEVLFSPGTHFKILSRQEKGGGNIEFVMAEVDEEGHLTANLPGESLAH
jgi:hypothetical protein